MDYLLEKSNRLIQHTSLQFQRQAIDTLPWDWRLLSIIGARGVGKTTLLLQQAKRKHGVGQKAIYISLDDIYFADNRLSDFIDVFYKRGGMHLYIDEVHKYPNWARELKNVYDFYPSIHMAFTGSSIVDLLKQNVDLSRRALREELNGLSFREYLSIKGIFHQESIALEELINNHQQISEHIIQHIRPLQHFSDYVKQGYYPFFLEGIPFYRQRLEQMIRLVIETDLQYITGYDPKNARKIYQLFYILATNVPFKPNISKLSEKIGIHRNTLIQYLHHLEQARLIHTLYPAGSSISSLQKPEKLFLQNTNLAYAIAPQQINVGSLRETFILNQLKTKYNVSLPQKGDFLVEEKYYLEVGGKGKKRAQIAKLPNAYIVADDIEIGTKQKIPLWLFGFLY